MTNANPSKRIRLKPIDLQILRSIEEHGFRTNEELRLGVLKSYSRQWSWTIMKRLVQAGLIREVRQSGGELLGWTPVLKARPEVLSQIAWPKIERGKIAKYASSFHHDKEVRWALDQFQDIPAVKRIITESKLKQGLFTSIQGYSRRELNRLSAFIPDASIILRHMEYDYRVAIEVELTRKSNIRMRSKIEHYLTKSGYDFVIYICGDQKIFEHVRRNHQFVLQTSPAVKFAEKEVPIYQGLIFDLKRGFLKARFLGQKDEFALEQFLT